MTALRVVTIRVTGKRDRPAVVCGGIDATHCGELHIRPGVCRNPKCRRVLTEAEFSAALAAAGQPDRWATVEAGEAA
ncbi:MAG TPA: hypothetical protein VIR34_18540 [Gemmatimonadaceae bacterium]